MLAAISAIAQNAVSPTSQFQFSTPCCCPNGKRSQSRGRSLTATGNSGNYARAIESQQQSLAIARDINDRRGEGESLINLGVTHRSRGNYVKAIEYHEQSLVITREIKDRRGEGSALGNLGMDYYCSG